MKLANSYIVDRAMKYSETNIKHSSDYVYVKYLL